MKSFRLATAAVRAALDHEIGSYSRDLSARFVVRHQLDYGLLVSVLPLEPDSLTLAHKELAPPHDKRYTGCHLIEPLC
jgi:hypothetical protein